MGTWIAYTLVAGLLLAVMYIVYKWLMAGEKQPTLNRYVILGCYVLAATLPLCDLAHHSNIYGGNIAVGQLTAVGIDMVNASSISSVSGILINFCMYIYLAGVIAILSYLIVGQIKILRIIKQGEKINCSDYTIVLTEDRNLIPFSWHGFIVMTHSDYYSDACASILTHELTHVARRHSIDLILTNLFCVAIWYNPAVWKMEAELRSAHEYEADQSVLLQGHAAHEYQLILLKKAVGRSFPVLANSLNHSNLKKRITMMQKSNSTKSRRARVLALIPATALALAVINTPLVSNALERLSDTDLSALSTRKVNENSSENNYLTAQQTQQAQATKGSPQDDVVYDKPDVLPQFPGGEVAMMKFLMENLQYPESEMKREGKFRVIVGFIVTSEGKIGDIKIINSQGEAFDNEARRVVGIFPAFTPGKVDGKPVAVSYVLPIVFAAK